MVFTLDSRLVRGASEVSGQAQKCLGAMTKYEAGKLPTVVFSSGVPGVCCPSQSMTGCGRDVDQIILGMEPKGAITDSS